MSMKTLLALGLVSLAILVWAAAPALALTDVPANVAYESGIVYCTCDDGTQLQLDVARPRAGSGPFPAVVCIHGGGWVRGDRSTNRDLILKLAQEGFVGVTVSYRLAPKYPYPAAIHDVKCAVRWLRANAENYCIDKDRIAALGYSSGGLMACLLGMTSGSEFEGNGGCAEQSSRVQAVVSFYGLTDLGRWHQTGSPVARFVLPQFLGSTPDKRLTECAKASPTCHVSDRCPPILFLHGTKDTIVPFEQSQLLRDRLEAEGLRPELIPFKGANHNFDDKEEHRKIAYTAVFSFLSRQLMK
jgi:acetyl esterase/lipase